MENAVIKFSPAPGIQIEADGAGADIGESKQISRAFNLLFNLLLISFFLGFLFNLPFKRYFTLRRKESRFHLNCLNFVKNTCSNHH